MEEREAREEPVEGSRAEELASAGARAAAKKEGVGTEKDQGNQGKP